MLSELVSVKALIASECIYGGKGYVSAGNGTKVAVPSLVFTLVNAFTRSRGLSVCIETPEVAIWPKLRTKWKCR